jgi:hypothetical protein
VDSNSRFIQRSAAKLPSQWANSAAKLAVSWLVGGEVQSSDTGGVPYEPTFNFNILSSLAFPSIEFASTLLQYQFSKLFAELCLSEILPKKTSVLMIAASSLWRA